MSTKKGRTGRPRAVDGPLIPDDELRMILIHGESAEMKDGKVKIRHPSYQELADRYGVSYSRIANFARDNQCQRKRKEETARLEARISEKVLELRARTLAVTIAEEVRILDGYIRGFEEAMAEGHVRFNDPSHLNMIMRLKHFKLGGPDSRQEVQGMPSIEELQRRYATYLKLKRESTPGLRGEVDFDEPGEGSSESGGEGELSVGAPEGREPEVEDESASRELAQEAEEEGAAPPEPGFEDK